jgi:hypothetical protein
MVIGDFTVGGGGTKSVAVPFTDGSHRRLYCMESPECWFEDFGTAKLKGGRAVVKLDADFAKVITRDYRVFPTPEGDCRGLYVHRRSAGSFEVRELMGGRSSITFSYRIVGRRRALQHAGRGKARRDSQDRKHSDRAAGRETSRQPVALEMAHIRAHGNARSRAASTCLTLFRFGK